MATPYCKSTWLVDILPVVIVHTLVVAERDIKTTEPSRWYHNCRIIIDRSKVYNPRHILFLFCQVVPGSTIQYQQGINQVVWLLDADCLKAVVYETIYYGYEAKLLVCWSICVGNLFIIAISHLRSLWHTVATRHSEPHLFWAPPV